MKFLSCGADKSIICRNVLQRDELSADEMLQTAKQEVCKGKVFDIAISEYGHHVISGNDKFLCVYNLSELDKILEKRPDSLKKSGT